MVLVLAARQAKSDRGVALADAMIGSEAFAPATLDTATSEDFRCALVAAEQLLEIGMANLASSKPRTAVRKRVATWLAGGPYMIPATDPCGTSICTRRWPTASG